MEEKLYIQKLIEKSNKFEIDKYREININKTHTVFEGTPKKHPNDENILLLLTSPFSNNKFYEFSIDSIGNIEEIGTITSEKGESAMKVRVWVKKGMLAIKSETFVIK